MDIFKKHRLRGSVIVPASMNMSVGSIKYFRIFAPTKVGAQRNLKLLEICFILLMTKLLLRTRYVEKNDGYLKTENIGTLFVDPIALAVWYLDDGTKRADCLFF